MRGFVFGGSRFSRFGISGLGFRVLGLGVGGLGILGFWGFRISHWGFRGLGLRVQVSQFGVFAVHRLVFGVSSMGLAVPDFGLGVSWSGFHE